MREVVFKSAWVADIKRNEADYPRMIGRELFGNRWRIAAPQQIEPNATLALKIRFGDGLSEHSTGFIRRAQTLIDAVESEKVMDDPENRSQALWIRRQYYYGRALLLLLQGKSVPPAYWDAVVEGSMDHVSQLRAVRDDSPREWLLAVKCLILSGKIADANTLVTSRKQCKSLADEFAALKLLCHQLAAHGFPVLDEFTRRTVLDYFEKYRDPGYHPPNKVGGPGAGLPNEQKFLWGLIVGQCIEPGDGRIDAERAIERTSR